MRGLILLLVVLLPGVSLASDIDFCTDDQEWGEMWQEKWDQIDNYDWTKTESRVWLQDRGCYEKPVADTQLKIWDCSAVETCAIEERDPPRRPVEASMSASISQATAASATASTSLARQAIARAISEHVPDGTLCSCNVGDEVQVGQYFSCTVIKPDQQILWGVTGAASHVPSPLNLPSITVMAQGPGQININWSPGRPCRTPVAKAPPEPPEPPKENGWVKVFTNPVFVGAAATITTLLLGG